MRIDLIAATHSRRTPVAPPSPSLVGLTPRQVRLSSRLAISVTQISCKPGSNGAIGRPLAAAIDKPLTLLLGNALITNASG